MRAGRLRHRVTLQQPVQVRNADGTQARDWLDVGTAWAAVEPLRGREFLESGQQHADLTHRVVMRHRPVEATWRVVHGGHVLNIESVVDKEHRGVELELMCKEDAR